MGKKCKRQSSEAQNKRCEHHDAVITMVPIILVAVAMAFIEKCGAVVVWIYYASLLQINMQWANKLENILKFTCLLDSKIKIQVWQQYNRFEERRLVLWKSCKPVYVAKPKHYSTSVKGGKSYKIVYSFVDFW